MRSILWLGSGAAALLILVAAIIGLRGTTPDRSGQPTAQQPPAATVPQVAAKAGPAAPSPAPVAPSPPQAVPAAPLPSFDVVTVDPHGQAVLAGRAAPGDRVRVLDGDQVIGEVTADGRGEWVLVPDAPVAAGNRQLALEATGHDGGSPRRSADVVAMSVSPPPSGRGAQSALAILLPGDANRPARILQRPESGETPASLGIDTVEYDAHDRFAVSGHADAGARVAVYAGERLLGKAVADPAGKWSLGSLQRQANWNRLRLDQLAADGSIAFSIAVPLEGATGTAAGGGDTYVVERGNSLWVIARRLYGRGTRYTEIYRANQDQIQDPDRIYPGQQFKLPKS
jgi:nucleoid-associated protein YgaU